MTDIKVEPFYQRQAEDMTTTLFDKGFLNPELSRDAINWLEDYIGFVIQSSAQSATKCAMLTAKLRNRVV